MRSLLILFLAWQGLAQEPKNDVVGTTEIPSNPSYIQVPRMSDEELEFTGAFSSDYQAFQKCKNKICPNLKNEDTQSLGGGSLWIMDSMDQAMLPVIKAMQDYVNKNAEMSEHIFQHAAQLLKGEPDQAMQWLSYSSVISDALEPLAVRQVFYKDQVTDEQLRPFVAKKLEGQTSSLQDRLLNNTFEAAKNPRLLAIGLTKLGAAYKYRMMYPNLDYQAAARQDLRDTQRKLRSAAPEIRALARQIGFESDLIYWQTKIGENSYVDEVDGQDIQAATDHVQMLLYSRRALSKSENKDLGLKITQGYQEAMKQNPQYEETLKNLKFERISPEVKNLSPKQLEKAYIENWGSTGYGQYQFNFGGTADTNSLKLNKMEYAHAECLTEIARGAQKLPTAKQIQNFKKWETKIRANVKHALKGKFSKQTEGFLNQYVDSVRFLMPPASDNFLKNLEKFFQRKAADAQNVINEIGKDKKRAVLMAFRLSDSEDGEPHERFKAACKHLTFQPVRDNTVSELGGIAVGSESILEPKIGQGVLSHEIGHGILNLLASGRKGISEDSKKRFSDVKDCVVAGHKALFDKLDELNRTRDEARRDLRPRNLYLAEDFSDMIGGASTPVNYWCRAGHLGTQIETTYRFDDPDRHSVGIYRLLNIEMSSRRGVPKECEPYLKATGSNLKKCI